MRWNLQSNVCDVLALGPRTAGRLATVGIRTVADLLKIRPATVARRLRDEAFSTTTLAVWQREAQLIVHWPELPSQAARLLAAVGVACAEQITNRTPTELLAALEVAQQENNDGWLEQIELPSVTEVSSWIRIACESQKTFAA